MSVVMLMSGPINCTKMVPKRVITLPIIIVLLVAASMQQHCQQVDGYIVMSKSSSPQNQAIKHSFENQISTAKQQQQQQQQQRRRLGTSDDDNNTIIISRVNETTATSLNSSPNGSEQNNSWLHNMMQQQQLQLRLHEQLLVVSHRDRLAVEKWLIDNVNDLHRELKQTESDFEHYVQITKNLNFQNELKLQRLLTQQVAHAKSAALNQQLTTLAPSTTQSPAAGPVGASLEGPAATHGVGTNNKLNSNGQLERQQQHKQAHKLERQLMDNTITVKPQQQQRQLLQLTSATSKQLNANQPLAGSSASSSLASSNVFHHDGHNFKNNLQALCTYSAMAINSRFIEDNTLPMDDLRLITTGCSNFFKQSRQRPAAQANFVMGQQQQH